jgi:hypothetical protein
MKKFALASLAIAVALAITPVALADTLQLLGNTPTSVTGTSASTNLGTVVATTSGSKSDTDLTGAFTETVYVGGDESLCTGCLSFVFTVSNTGSADFIDTITTGDFGAFIVEEGNLSPATSTLKAQTASDSAGVVKLFLNEGSVDDDINPGKSLDTFVLATNATHIGNSTITLQDDDVVQMPDLVAATPEPSSLFLLGSGLLSLAMLVFWKAKANRLVLHS